MDDCIVFVLGDTRDDTDGTIHGYLGTYFHTWATDRATTNCSMLLQGLRARKGNAADMPQDRLLGVVRYTAAMRAMAMVTSAVEPRDTNRGGAEDKKHFVFLRDHKEKGKKSTFPCAGGKSDSPIRNRHLVTYFLRPRASPPQVAQHEYIYVMVLVSGFLSSVI